MAATMVERIFKDHGIRKTDFRVQVLEHLINAGHNALASADLEKLLEHPDRITLYRTLKTFEQKGIIHHAIDGSGVTKYALCEEDCSENHHHDDHAHFHCDSCGQTICLTIPVEQDIHLPSGYSMSHAHLVIQGTCPKCQ